MGCAPSCHGGMRHALGDPFRSTVVPMGPYVGGWTHPHFAEVPFALHEERMPSIAAREEPPPYSEFAVDGQVTLMRGQSPIKEELEVQDRHSMMEPWRSSPVHPPSTQGPNSSMEFMEEGEMAPIHAPPSASFSVAEFSNPPEYNTTSHLEASLHSVGSLEHFGHPGIHRHAVFPLRSQSWNGDTSPPYSERSRRRESYPFITPATPTNLFPPRPDAVLPLQPSYPPPLAPLHSQLPPLPPVHSPPPPLLTPVPSFQGPRTININTYPLHPTPPPHTFPPPQYPHTRLPPLQRHTHQHRKKGKRKRGHTWHGERPTVQQETTVQ